MDAIRKQASRLREQVSRQQQAVFKQFGGGGHGSGLSDNAELHQHQKLEKLYISTRAAKHYQRDIVRGVEGYIVTGSKQVEIGTKLSEDSRKYGSENTCTNGNVLTKAALSFGRARAQMEKERGNMLKALGTQVAEPLRAMVMGAPLEDARHLAQRYDRIRQEAEAQATEVARRQAKARESNGHPDILTKLESAEAKLQDLKSNMTTLGKEAASALSSVEDQQQKLTLERLISMVESERAYHQRVLQILDQLEGEMVSERQRIEAPTSPSSADNMPPPPYNMPPPPSYEEANGVFASHMHDTSTDSMGYFLGEVWYSWFEIAQSEMTQGGWRLAPSAMAPHCQRLVYLQHKGTTKRRFYRFSKITKARKSDVKRGFYVKRLAMGSLGDEVLATRRLAPWRQKRSLFQTKMVLFPYHGVTDVELSLTAGEYVVVRKVTGSGWAEGECKGKAGWFPYEYIERRERVLASKVSEVF